MISFSQSFSNESRVPVGTPGIPSSMPSPVSRVNYQTPPSAQIPKSKINCCTIGKSRVYKQSLAKSLELNPRFFLRLLFLTQQ